MTLTKAFLVLPLMFFTVESWDVLNDGVFKNNTCILLGIQLTRQISIDYKLFQDRVMFLLSSEDFPILGDFTYLSVNWPYWHFSDIVGYVGSFHALVEDSIKRPSCAVILHPLGNVSEETLTLVSLLKKFFDLIDQILLQLSDMVNPFQESALLTFPGFHNFDSFKMFKHSILHIGDKATLMARQCIDHAKVNVIRGPTDPMWQCNKMLPATLNIMLAGYFTT